MLYTVAAKIYDSKLENIDTHAPVCSLASHSELCGGALLTAPFTVPDLLQLPVGIVGGRTGGGGMVK